MTTDITPTLDAIRARLDAATGGPWEHDGDRPARHWGVVYQTGVVVDSIGQSDRPVFTLQGSSIPRESWMADATFIAHARTDLDVAEKALRAVVEVHRPVHRVFSWNSGVRDEEPCPDCHGKAGVHECGCWADSDMTYSCAECRSEKGGGVDYPCPTIRAITTAFEAGEVAK